MPMNPTILHIYGPIAIQWYGVMIILGIALFMAGTLRNPLRKRYSTEQQFIDLIFGGIAVGIVGGRLLHVITEWQSYETWLDIFKIWEGGFSVLGTLIALALYGFWYLRHHKIPIIPIFDLVTLYAPLLQATARIGCLFAGCCGGIVTANGLRHPTPLYSSLSYLLIFFIMRFAIFNHLRYQGVMLAFYLIFASTERFIVDFWRCDRIFLSPSSIVSIHQWIALVMCFSGIVVGIWSAFSQRKYGHF
jgi:phosphatidylglycerol---prolipoprotein diacylglyceryl transferase